MQTRREFLKTSALAIATATGAETMLTGCNSSSTASKTATKLPKGMQLGLVTYKWGEDWDVPTLITNCRDTGLTVVELRVEHAHHVSPALTSVERKNLAKQFKDGGVILAGFGTNYEFHSPDPANLKANIAGAKEYLQLSADCGASGVKVKPNDLPKGVPQEKTISQIAIALNELGKYAADLGQELRLEVHGGCAPLPIMKAIMDEVTEPSVGLCWNCNPQDIENPGLAYNFNLVKNRLGHTVHIRSLTSDTYPTRELFNLLIKAKYNGYLLIEEGGNTPPANERLDKLKRSAELFKQWI
jgi:sugar phosphate isomerase/epimerase